MSIENKIDALLEAVEALTSALYHSRFKLAGEEPTKSEVHYAGVTEVFASAGYLPAQIKTEDQKVVSYDDVKAAVVAMSKAQGVPAVVALLASFGVKKATELRETQWLEFISKAV